MDDVREFVAQFLGALAGRHRADGEHVDECRAGVANGFEEFSGVAAAVVLDDDAGARADVGLEPRLSAPRVAQRDGDAGFVQTSGERPIVDDELDLEPGQQDLVEHPDDQFVLTNR